MEMSLSRNQINKQKLTEDKGNRMPQMPDTVERLNKQKMRCSGDLFMMTVATIFLGLCLLIALPYLIVLGLLSLIFCCSPNGCLWIFRDGPKSHYRRYGVDYHNEDHWETFILVVFMFAISFDFLIVGIIGYDKVVMNSPSVSIDETMPLPPWGNSSTLKVNSIDMGWIWSYADTTRDLNVVKVCDWRVTNTVVVQSANRTIATADYSVYGEELWTVNVSSGVSFVYPYQTTNKNTLPFVSEYVTLMVYRDDVLIAYSTDVREPMSIISVATRETIIEIDEGMTSIKVNNGDSDSNNNKHFGPHELIAISAVRLFGDGKDRCDKKSQTYYAFKFAGYTFSGFLGILTLFVLFKNKGC